MSTTPLSGSILAHFFTKDEKLSFYKSLGVLIGFSGIILLFFDKVIINNENYIDTVATYIKDYHPIIISICLCASICSIVAISINICISSFFPRAFS